MSKKLKVGLQLSIGGLGDKSFNDSAFSGVEEAKEKLGVEVVHADWQDPEQNEVTLEEWASSDIDLIIAAGFGNAKPVNAVAARHPDKRFALVDVAGEGDNVWSATYREYGGSL